MAKKFSRTPEAKHNWISGCISVFEANAAPESEFYDNVGLDIIVRNSQNN